MARKTKTDDIDARLNAKLDRWWEAASSARKRIDWQWFLYDLWREGYHYARYDTATQQILSTPKVDGTPKVMVNKIESTTRAVVNYALRNRPKAEVTPQGMTPDNIQDVAKQNSFLDYMHDRLGLREIERGAVDESLTAGLAWVQILWDEDADDGQGEITVNEIDKYDLYWYTPRARRPEEVHAYILAVSRPIDELKRDPKYKAANWDTVKSDNTRSSSSLKERLLRLETGDDSVGQAKGEETVMVREYWYFGDKELGEDPEKIYVCAKAGGQIIRRPEATDLTRLPFFRLCTARRKHSMVGKSWIKNLIPLNKRLNQLMSSLAEYNLIMNRGKWVADKGAGVRVINNQHGQIIEKKRGFDVRQEAIAPLSAVLIQELNYILQLFEDIGAVHDATMGRIPTGAKSGKALEALQVGDSNNLAEIVENTELWLEEIYEYILTLAAEKYQFVREATPVSNTGQREFIRVIGEGATQADDAAPAGETVVLRKKNVVDVKITSYLAHTPEARREAVRELASLIPDLDPQTILSVYEIGPIADIVMRIRENRQELQQAQLAQQGAAQEMTQPAPSGPQEAIAVIRQVLNGQPPQLPARISPEFIAYFDQFLQSPEAQQLPPQISRALQTLRDQLQVSGGAQGMQPAMQQQPATVPAR